MLAAALISCALMMAIFLHQHWTIGRDGRSRARASAATPSPWAQGARPAKLYREGPHVRTDWTKLEAYDPLPLHEFDWSEPRIARDGNAVG